MMHAAGFDHEQCRIDRDNHVNVVFDNIVSDYKHNYENHGTWRGWEDSGNYDFDSIMHYGDTFFQKPGKGFTMSREVGGGRIHSHNVMTKDDIAALDSLYGAAPDILAWVDGGNFIRKKYADAASKCSGAGYTIPSKARVLAHWADITKLLDVAKTPACVWTSEPADAGRHWILHFKSADEANEGIESAPNDGTCTVLCTRNP